METCGVAEQYDLTKCIVNVNISQLFECEDIDGKAVVTRVLDADEETGENTNAVHHTTRFSAPGDSGSLVFIESDGLLYPISVHYAGMTDGSESASIPLWRILYDFCKKQGLDNLNLRFLNPLIEGVLEFKCSEFENDQSSGKKE